MAVTEQPDELDGPRDERSNDAAKHPAQPQEPKSLRKIGPSFAAPETHVQDLSAEIAHTVSRAAGERVTCRRICGSHYRCNWWAPASGADDHGRSGATCLIITTHRVRKSELLFVTKNEHGLVIKTAPSGRN
jgi:hypothetical protein